MTVLNYTSCWCVKMCYDVWCRQKCKQALSEIFPFIYKTTTNLLTIYIYIYMYVYICIHIYAHARQTDWVKTWLSRRVAPSPCSGSHANERSRYLFSTLRATGSSRLFPASPYRKLPESVTTLSRLEVPACAGNGWLNMDRKRRSKEAPSFVTPTLLFFSTHQPTNIHTHIHSYPCSSTNTQAQPLIYYHSPITTHPHPHQYPQPLIHNPPITHSPTLILIHTPTPHQHRH